MAQPHTAKEEEEAAVGATNQISSGRGQGEPFRGHPRKITRVRGGAR